MMANPYADEIKWWNDRASTYRQKRTELKPISFDYLSRQMSDYGNYNGASSFNSARAKLLADYSGDWRNRLTISDWAWQEEDKTQPIVNARTQPSEGVYSQVQQNESTVDKIQSMGGSAFRGAVSGLMGVADLISRPGYALRASSMTYAKDNAADGNTSFWDHVENAARPILDMAASTIAVPYNAVTGGSDESLTAMWQGFTGKDKAFGGDILDVVAPEFMSDHSKWGSALGFAVDVAYDPLSWITLGQGTVVTGAGKGAAAVAAGAVGKKTLSRELLSNTVWTTTGRAGGKAAVKESIYKRAAKPYTKQQDKIEKTIRKSNKKATKAKNKGKDVKEKKYFDRAERAQKIKDDTFAQLNADILAVRAESMSGARLAWKAVANKSLGLGSLQSYGKGVNTAGLKSRSAAEFSRLQDLAYDDVIDVFKSPDNPNSHAWRSVHSQAVGLGKTEVKGTDYVIPADYDDFVDSMVSRIFIKEKGAPVTKKDKAHSHGMYRSREAAANNFYYKVERHLKHELKDARHGVPDLAWSASRGKYVNRERLVKENLEEVDNLIASRNRPKSPGDTDSIHTYKAEAQRSEHFAKRAAAKRRVAETKGVAIERGAALSRAIEYERKASEAAAKSSDALKTARGEEALIKAAVDDHMARMAEATANQPQHQVSTVSKQTDEAALADQAEDMPINTAVTRDDIVMSAEARLVVDEGTAKLASDVVESLRKTKGAENARLNAGAVDDIPGMVQGQKASGKYTREINYRIAEEIHANYQLMAAQLTGANMADDVELAMDMIQNHTNHLLNRMLASTHSEVFTHLNEMGLSLMADAPEWGYAISQIVDVSPTTGLRSMDDVLTNDGEKWVTEFWGRKSPSDRLPATAGAAEKLRAHIPESLQSQHRATFARYFDDHSSFNWGDVREGHEFRLEHGGVLEDIQGVERMGLDIADDLEIPDGYGGFDDLMYADESKADVYRAFTERVADLNARNHTQDTVALGHYTFYDYWVLGHNTAKETAPARLTKRGGTKGSDKMEIGRAGFLSTAEKAKGKYSDDAEGLINEAINTMPAMDEELMRLTRIVHGWLSPKPGKNAVQAKGKVVSIRNNVGAMLVPDLKRVAVGEKFENINPAAQMKTLGSHVFLLSETSTLNSALTSADKILLANKVWQTPVKITQMNESIMLYNLHNIYVMGMNPQKAAQVLARRLEQGKHATAAKFMKDANLQGTTNGAQGLRRAHPSSADATPQAAASEMTSPVAKTPDDIKAEKLNSSLEGAKIRSANAANADDANQLRAAAAMQETQDASMDAIAATDDAAAAVEDMAKLKSKADNFAEGSVPKSPDPDVTGPGGYTHPPMTEDELAAIDDLIADLTMETNFAQIGNEMDTASKTMSASMAEYHSKMQEVAEGFDVVTKRSLKVAGIPIMTLGRSRSTGMTEYAGLVGMKEKQGAVANWLKKSQSYQNNAIKTRKPTSLHEGILEEMRRTVSGLNENMVTLAFKAVQSTYKGYKKATLRTDKNHFFDAKYTDDIPGLAPFKDRLLAVSNALDGRVRRSLDEMDTDKVLDKSPGSLYADSMKEQLVTLNASMPRPYRLREDVLKGFANETEHVPWSREWISDLADHLDEVHRSHPLSRTNINKDNFDIRGFDFITQNGAARMDGSTMLHDSMFDNFTFTFSPEYIDELNIGRTADDKYVLVSEHVAYKNVNSVYGDVGGRYATNGMLNEMAKITDFYHGQASNTLNTASQVSFTKLQQINNHWKGVVTAWNIPRYHIGNVMADGFLSAMDGTGVGSYRKAGIVMANSHVLRRKIGEDPESFAKLLRPDTTLRNLAEEKQLGTIVGELSDPKRAARVMSVTIEGRHVNFSSEDLYKAYLDYGLSQGQTVGNLSKTAMGSNKAKKGYDSLNMKVMELSQGREDYFRMAHFIHAIENEALIPGRTQAEILKSARDRVIKYHFDYGDVSEVERLTVGKYMPFYKWSRNVLPLAMTQMVTNPKSYIIQQSADRAMGEMMFPTEEDADGNEIPIAYVIPEWVGDSNMVPIGTYTDPEGNEQAKYAVLNLPLNETLGRWLMPFIAPWQNPTLGTGSKINQSLLGGSKSAVASSHPLLKAVIQGTTDKTVVPGDAYNTSSEFDWIKGLVGTGVPFINQVERYQKSKARGTADTTDMMDSLLGILRETHATEANVKGSLYRESDILKPQQVKTQNDWLAKNHPGVDPQSDEGKEIIHDFYVKEGILKR